MKITIVFEDDELYRAVEAQAAKLGRPMKAVVTEALEAWLEALEGTEDLAEYRASMAEYRDKGGIPWEQIKAKMRAILAERQAAGGVSN